MTSAPTDWSLAGKLRRRAWAAISLISVFMVAVVGLHYGTDVPELRHRSLHMLGEKFARDAQLAYRRNDWNIINKHHRIFREHADNYTWAVLDAAGRVIAASEETPPAEEIWIASGPFPDVWTSETNTGGWIGGRSFTVDGFTGHIVIEIREDTAGLLPMLIVGEILVHVVLPIAPFALLLFIGLEAALRMTIEPLKRYSDAVSGVEPGNRLQPLDLNLTPAEVSGIVRKLNDTIDKLNSATEREKTFIAQAAHSLRTPLAALKARLELDGGNAPAEVLKAEVDALIRFANQLLMSANAEKLVVNPDALADLSDVAISVVARLTPSALVSGIDLGVEGADASVPVTGNPDALAQALSCLVENALQSTPRGGTVLVRVSSAPPRLTVTDTGTGFVSAASAARTLPDSQFGQEVRAGLGLRIARQIANAHKANLHLGDGTSAGAAVSLSFPEPQQPHA
ncbi:sensor histidine kinase [Hyphomonas sp.]|uniref:sensor histidine kinase n=1 Tax=Hyphomonas sp. TaxID=87 RepID=UPI003918897A